MNALDVLKKDISILDLPSELILNILSKLDETNLSIMPLVCLFFKEISTDNVLWKDFCKNRCITTNSNDKESEKGLVIKKISKYIITLGPVLIKLNIKDRMLQLNENFRIGDDRENQDVYLAHARETHKLRMTKIQFNELDAQKKIKSLFQIFPKNAFEAESFIRISLKKYTDLSLDLSDLNNSSDIEIYNDDTFEEDKKIDVKKIFRKEILMKENLIDAEKIKMLLEAGARANSFILQRTRDLGASTDVLQMLRISISKRQEVKAQLEAGIISSKKKEKKRNPHPWFI